MNQKSKTNEAALEALIEKALTGGCREEAKAAAQAGEVYTGYHHDPAVGWLPGQSGDYDAVHAIDTAQLWAFLEATQPEELAKLSDRPNYKEVILGRLSKKIAKDGVITMLRKGLSIDDATFDLMYKTPYSALNPEVIEKFDCNRFSVTRQVHYSVTEPDLSVDMVLFLNGLPVVSIELKNPWTGQNWRHAVKQYCKDRDPREPLFQFGRCLVHFALDPDEAHMCTQVNGEKSFFLPFNKGHDHGKGNPPNPNGVKTSYLWEEVFERKSLCNIIEHFATMVETKDEKTGKKKKTLFFPRYHQMDVVRKLLGDVKAKGTGKTYLIQHSAGSGKSNSITWLAFQLIELYGADGMSNVLDTVVVVTDRRILNKQIRDNITQFAKNKSVIAKVENSEGLRLALEQGKKLIITTIQKFPFIVDEIQNLGDRKFGVIIDEAHSSQSGSAADKMVMSMGGTPAPGSPESEKNVAEVEAMPGDEIGSEPLIKMVPEQLPGYVIGPEDDGPEDVPEDYQDQILAAMKGRKLGGNASYFAFTATPKSTTLEKFGVQRSKMGTDGKPGFDPFHLYSMKQAIEEGFILDVLRNYTTYKSYYEIQKSIQDNPLFETSKAQKKLRAYVEAHPETIGVKARIMVDHFVDQVWKAKKMKGKAKAMVVTRNIVSAIRYYWAIQAALEENKVPFKAVVAFSGTKQVDGVDYTEEGLNGFPSKDIPEMFEGDDYKLLVVANKFLTGFDEPQLHTMYVDKRLQGVLAVQTLSRLNRANKKLEKDETFVLDFYNTTDEIKSAFDPFYTATSLSEPTDVNVLHDLKDTLDEVGVYEWAEVEAFNEKYFSKADADELHPITDAAAERFVNTLELEHEEKLDFKIKSKQFVKIYAQVACLIPFDNLKWEMLHWFLKFLIPKLTVQEPDEDKLDALLESVDLGSYGLERNRVSFKIDLDEGQAELDPANPNPRGYHGESEVKDPLDEIVKSFNERFMGGWDATPEEQKIKLVNIAQAVYKDKRYEEQVANNKDEQNRRLALEMLIKDAVHGERRRELDLYRQYAKDDQFKAAFDASVMRMLLSVSPEQLMGEV